MTYLGLRPGEKLYEELLVKTEELDKTPNSMIFMKNTLDNYNFEAYIPTLIPLLTGDNIYSSKSVFARELIQNSIDAISVREAKDKSEFSKEISIEAKVLLTVQISNCNL